jgi:hypothetical protein
MTKHPIFCNPNVDYKTVAQLLKNWLYVYCNDPKTINDDPKIIFEQGLSEWPWIDNVLRSSSSNRYLEILKRFDPYAVEALTFVFMLTCLKKPSFYLHNHTLDDWRSILPKFIDFFNANKDQLIKTGYPGEYFFESNWLFYYFAHNLPTRKPLGFDIVSFPEDQMPRFHDVDFQSSGWFENAIGDAPSLIKENTPIVFWWGLKEERQFMRNPKIYGMDQEYVIVQQINKTYHEANRYHFLTPDEEELIITAREHLFDLKLSVLKNSLQRVKNNQNGLVAGLCTSSSLFSWSGNLIEDVIIIENKLLRHNVRLIGGLHATFTFIWMIDNELQQNTTENIQSKFKSNNPANNQSTLSLFMENNLFLNNFFDKWKEIRQSWISFETAFRIAVKHAFSPDISLLKCLDINYLPDIKQLVTLCENYPTNSIFNNNFVKKTCCTFENLSPQKPKHYIQRCADYYIISYNDKTVHINNYLGMKYIAYLIEHPNQEHTAVQVKSLGNEDILPSDNNHEIFDMEAIKVLKLSNDPDVQKELKNKLNIKGNSRNFSNDSEKARKSVCNNIRRTLKKISESHSELFLHLEKSIKTGYKCSYIPPNSKEDLIKYIEADLLPESESKTV